MLRLGRNARQPTRFFNCVRYGHVRQWGFIAMEDLFRGLPNPADPSFAEIVNFSERRASKILAHMPAFTSLIASEVSFRDAYTISYQLSGKRIYLPKNADRFAAKIQCDIGAEIYERILDIACAEPHIEVPSSWGIFSIIRKIAIIEYLEQTQSKTQAQIEFGANRRFIDKLWNDQKLVGNPYPFLASERSCKKQPVTRSGQNTHSLNGCEQPIK